MNRTGGESRPHVQEVERTPERPEARRGLLAGRPEKSTAALKRRRNRRFLFVGLVGLSFPILEVIAYQFRVITITLANRSDRAVKGIKVAYAGGDFDAPELKPGGTLTRRIRPDFSFRGEKFSTYQMSIRFASEDGSFYSQIGRAGALDYSAQEVYTIIKIPPEGRIQLEHTTRPGFPLSLVRDLMGRLGFG